MPAGFAPASQLKQLQLWLKQPGAWPTIASIGIHGSLFALLPFLPSTAVQEREPDLQRSVDLVQLSPEEQSRIPRFSNPVTLPALPTSPSPASPFSNPDSFSLNPLPPAGTSFIPAPLPPTGLSNPFPSIFFPGLSVPLENPAPPQPAQVPVPNTPSSPSPTSTPSPSATPSESPSATLPDVSPAPPDAGTVTPPENGDRPSETAANPAPNGTSPAPDAPATPPIESLQARNEELRELYAYSGEGTSTEAANSTFGDWFYDKLKRTDLEQLQQGTIEAAYPERACVLQKDAASVVGVVVDGDNQLVGDPVLIQSSGYQRLFDPLALDVVEGFEFDNQGKPEQAYLITVKFNYTPENCPAGAVTAPAPPS